MTCVVGICTRLLGESCAKVTKDISFSTDTINEGVLKLLDDVTEQLINKSDLQLKWMN
jgi:hypothetical protein